ncbi:MAG: hypothetical protein JWO46_2509, partial [Nocardioidaceae bacterium]|nr:hypothetical protein [Nocardioidaceae bacterium]
MRKSLPLLLVFLGVFLIVFAILGFTYTSHGLQRTPLNTDSTTRLSGTASLSGGADFAVKATSITRSDAKKSDGKVIVF